MNGQNQYSPITPMRSFRVTELYSVHYFENFKNYYFSGEKHPFWELLYVDRGEIIVETDRHAEPLHMEQGSLLLYRPNEFHSFSSNDIIPNNLAVVAFSCSGTAIDYFQQQPLFSATPSMRRQISMILEAAQDSFSVSLADPDVEHLDRNANAPFGSEQILINILELLLISLYRQGNSCQKTENAEAEQEHKPHNYVQLAIAYMKENLTNPICLDDICSHAAISCSQLQKAFRRQTGMSVMRYMAGLRIEEAKFLIRSRNMNYTEIAEHLCYSSVHHFSRQFRSLTGMPPSSYATSVQIVTRRPK